MHIDSVTQINDPVMIRAQGRVGRVLREKWKLDCLLGVGGMAAVYAGTHRNGKRGAIKMLHPELSADPQIRERFLREGRAANHVGHPGAVSVLDDDLTEDGAIFLVMDLLEGESVESRRERAGGKLDVVDVLSITDQLLDVLAAAHPRGIVHRDLKPDNLFVTRDGAVKVLDFGIARLREGTTTKGTHTGISMGTPAFMAQEQARALWDDVDARTDLWAVGATMFICLTGRVVHEGRTMNEQLLSAMTRPAPAVRSLAPDVPREVAAVVQRALEVDRADRYQSAAEMQTAIRVAYEAMQSAPISTAPRLFVPDVALQKTMASLPFEGGPTENATAGPVAAGQTGAGRPHTSVGQRIAIGGGSAAVIVAATATAFFALRGGAPPIPAPSTTAAPPTASATSPPDSASAVAPVAVPAPPLSAEAPMPAKKDTRDRKPATKPDVAPPSPPPADPMDNIRKHPPK